MPKRIQRKRIKGWRMPDGAVYVGRPTKWGNPANTGSNDLKVDYYRRMIGGNLWTSPTRQEIKDELRGKDLACWCPLDRPCHADILLAIANGC